MSNYRRLTVSGKQRREVLQHSAPPDHNSS